MNSNILKHCLEKGILLDTEMHNFLSDFDEETAKKIVNKMSHLQEKVITKTIVSKYASQISEIIDDEKIINKLKIKLNLSFEISAEKKNKINNEERKPEEVKKTNEEFKILKSVPNTSRKIGVKEFTNYFRNRYNKAREVLRTKSSLDRLTSIEKIPEKRESVSIIGTVYDKRMTKNKNILLEVEDLTGKTRVLINNNKKELFDKGVNILYDDIIGVKGFGDREIIFANDIIYPDTGVPEKKKLDKDINIAFTSDFHIGSGNFLEPNLKKFIKWLNGEVGNEEQKKEALKVKYLLVAGDSVDGVGIFPGQEELLTIPDIKKQYEYLVSLLKEIRNDIKIIICPGQHDAVWVGEPQPAIEKDYAECLYEMENVYLVSNPAMIEINGSRDGLKILMYHGASMNQMVDEINSLRVQENIREMPTKIHKEVLKRRQIASTHSGGVTYVPMENDPLFIDDAPDIFMTADFHHTGIGEYNNIVLISSSCWQSKTVFEEKVGHEPDPCKVPIFNTKTRKLWIMDFSDESKVQEESINKNNLKNDK